MTGGLSIRPLQVHGLASRAEADRHRTTGVWLMAMLGLFSAAPATCSWAESALLPSEVQKEVQENGAACGSRKPQIEMGFLTSLDINGDGIPDYMLNYQNFRCGGMRTFCGSRGCLLQIFASTKDGKLEKVIDEDVWSVDINRGRGRPSLVLGLHGRACDLPVEMRCKVTFVWNGTTFVRTGRLPVP